MFFKYFQENTEDASTLNAHFPHSLYPVTRFIFGNNGYLVKKEISDSCNCFVNGNSRYPKDDDRLVPLDP